jgi:hypothetical protein
MLAVVIKRIKRRRRVKNKYLSIDYKMKQFMKKKYLWVVAILVIAYFLYTMYGMREGLAVKECADGKKWSDKLNMCA